MKSSLTDEEIEIPTKLLIEEIFEEKKIEPFYCEKHEKGRSQYLSPISKKCNSCKLLYLSIWKSYVLCNSCSNKQSRCQSCGDSLDQNIKEIEDKLLPDQIGDYQIIKKLN